MEYLMTYGWAILIIAVVLGVLFQLGIFSGSALAPKAQPGSCQVQRLLGQVSLEGLCQGQLPEYVASLSGATTGNVLVKSSTFPNNPSSASFSAWVYPQGSGGYGVLSVGTTCSSGGQIIINEQTDVQVYVGIGGSGGSWYYFGGYTGITPGKWSFITVTFNSGNLYAYVNGTYVANYLTGGVTTLPEEGNSGIALGSEGSAYGAMCNNLVGQLANVQIYNTTLSASEIKSLYQGGIGGAPIRLQNLVGWWPLNGNAQDYSGNNNNGQISAPVSFNSTWNAGYTPP